jgi:hypothetical protein
MKKIKKITKIPVSLGKYLWVFGIRSYIFAAPIPHRFIESADTGKQIQKAGKYRSGLRLVKYLWYPYSWIRVGTHGQP